MLSLAPVVLVLAPLLHAAPAPPPPRPEAKPLGCEVSDIRSPQARGRRDRFRATRVVDLEIEAILSGRARSERVLRLRVYAPGGFLYQVLELPIDPTHKHPRVLEGRLPVAGTSIMASGLYGRWSVVPHLDERTEPCGRKRRFVIQP